MYRGAFQKCCTFFYQPSHCLNSRLAKENEAAEKDGGPLNPALRESSPPGLISNQGLVWINVTRWSIKFRMAGFPAAWRKGWRTAQSRIAGEQSSGAYLNSGSRFVEARSSFCVLQCSRGRQQKRVRCSDPGCLLSSPG